MNDARSHEDRRVIPPRELAAYRAAFKLQIFRQIRKVFNQLKGREGFSQKDLAIALGVDEGLLSRRLQGKNDMRLETFSDLARGLECRINVELVPIAEIRRLAHSMNERKLWGDSQTFVDSGFERPKAATVSSVNILQGASSPAQNESPALIAPIAIASNAS